MTTRINRDMIVTYDIFCALYSISSTLIVKLIAPNESRSCLPMWTSSSKAVGVKPENPPIESCCLSSDFREQNRVVFNRSILVRRTTVAPLILSFDDT